MERLACIEVHRGCWGFHRAYFFGGGITSPTNGCLSFCFGHFLGLPKNLTALAVLGRTNHPPGAHGATLPLLRAKRESFGGWCL